MFLLFYDVQDVLSFGLVAQIIFTYLKTNTVVSHDLI